MNIDHFPVIAMGMCAYGLLILWSRGQILFALAGAFCWIFAAFTEGVFQNVMTLLGALFYIVGTHQFTRWLKLNRKSKNANDP